MMRDLLMRAIVARFWLTGPLDRWSRLVAGRHLRAVFEGAERPRVSLSPFETELERAERLAAPKAWIATARETAVAAGGFITWEELLEKEGFIPPWGGPTGQSSRTNAPASPGPQHGASDQ